MEPCLAASPSEVIRWCVKKIRPTTFFTGRLGMPQTKHDEGDKSRVEFFGGAASHCKALYSEWLQTRKDMADAHFEWKDDLRDKAVPEYANLSSRYISPLLDKHGPRIWPASHDVHNGQTISSDYPRKLIYTKEADRRTLTLYLYGWMICSLVPKLSAHPDSRYSKQRREPGLTAASAYQWFPDDGRAEPTVTSSHAPVSSASMLRRGDDTTHEVTEINASMPHSYTASTVPVAQMLPVQGVEEDSSHSPTICAATEALHYDHENDTESNTDAATSDKDEYQPSPAPARRIKRRGYSTCDPSTAQKKRQKHSCHGSTRTSTTVSARNKVISPRGYDEEAEGDDATSYPSPADIGRNLSGTSHNLQHIANTNVVATTAEQQGSPGRAIDASNVTIMASDTVTQGPRSSSTSLNTISHEHQALDANQTKGPNEDVDPITGEVETPDLPAGPVSRPTHTSTRPSLVVPIKLATSAHDTDVLRGQLGSRLADMRRVGLSDPNVLLLKSTVELLETLQKASHLRLREIYEDTFNHYQGAFNQWLQLLKNIIVFYEVTGFRGDLSDRDAFLEALPEGCPAAVEEALLHGRAHLKEWLHISRTSDETFAKQVASLLFHLGSWFRWMKQASIERMTTQFTQELLAWYD